MEYITPFLYLLNTMAPYLLLGFLLAGVIHAYVPRRLYARYLSQPDFRSVALAALFGVPLPLCSCGVIPTAMSLRREGASKGAVTSFLIATPQTGVDSIVATYSVLGLPFAVIRPVVSSIENGFALPPIEEFEKLINDRTRGILICNPNNPTGYLYTRREMMQIRDLVKRYDLFLFSDEVYREFIYTGSPYISACHLEGIEQNVVLIDSVSKRYSECGIRIGALITKNRALHDAVMKFCQARLSPPLVGQIVAEASIDAPREYHTEVYDEYIARRKCLIDGLNRLPGVYSPIPMGAFYTVARLPIDDSDRFCAWCLGEFDYEGETVMLAPASGFYSDPTCGRNEVRIAYVLCQQDLQRAIRVLGEALKRYRREVMGEE